MKSNIIIIDSPSNKRVKELIKAKETHFFFEGEKLVRDLINSNEDIETLIVEQSNLNKIKLNIDCLILSVTQKVIDKISSLKSSVKIIAVVRKLKRNFNVKNCKKIIALENIQDPGNLGTIFRSAAAFNIDLIILSKNSVKLNNSKFLRSAQNSIFHVPHLIVDEIKDIADKLSDKLTVYTTSSHYKSDKSNIINCADLSSAALIIFGSEGKGLDLKRFKEYKTLVIEHNSKIESLNIAIAASICMHSLYKK